jgi:hypothetical protein
MSCSAPSLSSLVSLSWQSNGRGSLQRQQWSAAPASMRAPGLGLSSGKTRHLPELYSIVYIVLNTRAPESERACVCVCVLEGGGGGGSHRGLRARSGAWTVVRGRWAWRAGRRAARAGSGAELGLAVRRMKHGVSTHTLKQAYTTRSDTYHRARSMWCKHAESMRRAAEQEHLSAYSVARVPRGVVLPCRRSACMNLLAPNRSRGWLLHHRVRRALQEPRCRQMFDVRCHCIGRRRPVPQRSGDQQRDEADEWQKPRQREPPLFGGIAHDHGYLPRARGPSNFRWQAAAGPAYAGPPSPPG